MKFIILVFNLKEIYLAFSPEKKKSIKNFTVYVLKNGVGRYNIFFLYFYTKLANSSFLCRFRVESVNVCVLARFDLSTFSSSTNNFAHAQNAFLNEFTVRSYEYCACQHDTRKSNSDLFPSF